MKVLFLVILVLCIGSMECQKKKNKSPAKKNLCQKDIRFIVSVMRVCNAFRRATRFRMKNWPYLRKYIRYALIVTLKNNKPPPKGKDKPKGDKDKPKGDKDKPKGDKDKPKGDGDNKGEKNKETRSYQDEDFSFDNFFDGDDPSENAVNDDDDDNTEDSESDASSGQSDAEAEIKKLRRYLKLSVRDRRAPKSKGKKRPRSKDPFKSLRILCRKMSRLMYRG